MYVYSRSMHTYFLIYIFNTLIDRLMNPSEMWPGLKINLKDNFSLDYFSGSCLWHCPANSCISPLGRLQAVLAVDPGRHLLQWLAYESQCHVDLQSQGYRYNAYFLILLKDSFLLVCNKGTPYLQMFVRSYILHEWAGNSGPLTLLIFVHKYPKMTQAIFFFLLTVIFYNYC